MKKAILMLVCMAWIGNNAMLFAASSCGANQKAQHTCCEKMTPCKTTCTMSHEKVKNTEGVVFSQVPQLNLVYDVIRLSSLDIPRPAKNLNSFDIFSQNEKISVPIYIQYHQFLI
ncbi:MAG: hypothetical protein A2Z91_07705 [Deltaproteobacteria bacterium GWA2_38_16]|nr:MAG: hypothetical protein A2Z91_07705 [Deltaproteobacteria bacterium GWA2_38_16]OGQ03072.1 MAG: hypothetical protein A3D19_03365 [Deltaproteobacteria bacterium RIFCSPHIGHO2_02_FULL_38_15]OGQ34970.1 MAG: hypothetical protein A3A72_07755 [Deltaproteobacteria bacterium RIFCSPLOWO2_01_FULL_38_9]OGQ63350.1 MAG: hypothetical protein A3G92_01305 [Deltaproteobacteria bacterium RIFCSPLOWO2_12_FULL_38_8]HBQ20511.1 hypothetical protein [Deltaproteobacteria bacterium]